jgi:crotonobetainyl-CoA:carnitine CoA-transferase CaiB-like acyl-CoA transferase
MKLAGLRVVDLSSFLPGPYLTMTLADHGAEVIKVEQPGEGDPGRGIGLADGPSTVFFRCLNRGKKSVVLDLKSPAERDALLGLCDTADVFVETFRPGVAERLGLGYPAVSARNPRIVYCSISAFGNTGPYRQRPAHDLALEAIGGVLGLTLGTDGEPAIPAVAFADHLSALQGLSAILMALLRREATGRGDYIDIAMHDVVLVACTNIVGPTFAENRQPTARHERSLGGSAFYQIYKTQDGRHLVLAGQELKFVENLLNALGRPDLIGLCRQSPGPHQGPVIDFLKGVFAGQTLREALAKLSELDVCFAPVNTLPEAFDDANVKARGLVVRDEQGRRHIAPAIRFQDEPSAPSLREPRLGEHSATLFAGLRGKSAPVPAAQGE